MSTVPPRGRDTCRGTDEKGNPCICLRFTKKPDQPLGEPPLCLSCNHIENGHPEQPFNIAQYVSSFSSSSGYQGARLAGGTRASAAEATAETNAGLRGRPKAEDSGDLITKSSKIPYT